MRRLQRFAAVACLAACAGASAPAEEESGEFSIIAPLAVESLLLDITRTEDRYVAVGERGHVLLSDDAGASWRQVQVPTRATLTGVYFADRERGWAVGHDAVILLTEDGGEQWQLVHADPQAFRPLLDVWFGDDGRGYAIGAYGYFLASEDGGRNWSERELTASRLDAGEARSGPSDGEDEDWYALDEYDFSQGISVHLNKIARGEGDRLYMAAETGAVFRSDDAGSSWLTLDSPYDGSFFGVLPLGGDSVLIFGLRGHLFRSDDAGASWTELESGSEAMLTDGAQLADGRIVLGGLAGTVLVSDDDGHRFDLHQQADRNGLQALVGAGPYLLAVGVGGLHRLDAGALGGGGR